MSTHKIRNYYKNYYIKQKQKKPHPALVGLQLDAHLCHPWEAQLSEGNNPLLKVEHPVDRRGAQVNALSEHAPRIKDPAASNGVSSL